MAERRRSTGQGWLCALAVTALPRSLAILVTVADLAWFAVSWIPGPGFLSYGQKPTLSRYSRRIFPEWCIANTSLDNSMTAGVV